MASMKHSFIPMLLKRLMCLALTAMLLTGSFMQPAEATTVEDSLVIGIQSSKTHLLRPLEPVERDLLSIYDLMYDGLITINDDIFRRYANVVD